MTDKLASYRYWQYKEEQAELAGNRKQARIYFKRSCFYAPLPRARRRG